MLKKSSRFAASSVVVALCFVLQLFSCNTKKSIDDISLEKSRADSIAGIYKSSIDKKFATVHLPE